VEKIESLTVAVLEPPTSTMRGSSGMGVSFQWY
jgi:hypothetical protein